jgi:two-component system, response regulator PdtaR
MQTGEKAPASSRLAGARVLVAEDEALIAMDIELSLQEQGCIVLGPTATIADTLASLSRDRPDVVLLDLHLLDGLATPIAATLAAMGVPFALLTGDRLDVLEHASLASLPYIVKPWRAGDLEQMVGQLLASPAARVSTTLPAAAAAASPAAPA